MIVLTGNEEYYKDLSEVCDWVKFSVTDCRGGDTEKVNTILKSHLSGLPRILIAMEGVTLIFKDINQSRTPE